MSLVLFLLPAVVVVDADAHQSKDVVAGIAPRQTSVKLPPQGLYEQCAPSDGVAVCVGRMQDMADAGFKLVLNYTSWFGSPEDVLALADGAEAAGLKIIWPLNDPSWRGDADPHRSYRELGRSCTGSDDHFIKTAIELVADLPATWGFYIGDELQPGEAGDVQALADTVRQLAPDKPLLYIARPGVARLAPFVSSADVVGADVYPVGSNDPPVGKVARQTRALVGPSKSVAVVLQSFAWSQYSALGSTLFPDRRRMLAMRNRAVRQAQPQMLLWYSYNDLMERPNPSQAWSDLRSAAFAPMPPAHPRPPSVTRA